MTFLAPGFFVAGLAVAGAIVGLHFIVTRQPRAAILPTARFVPDTPATTVARATRPTDLLVMLLRVLLVLAAGAGLARPVVTRARGATARAILVDVSRSATDSLAMRDSVRAVYRDGDAVVLFDSSARLLTTALSDSIAVLRPTDRRGNLSAALIAGFHAGSSLRDRADSIELIIISPFAREELDAATDSIRKLWPAKARIVRAVESAPETPGVNGQLAITADAGDPLAVTAALARTTVKARAIIDRRAFDDSVARGVRNAGKGEVLIVWPKTTRPRFAVARVVTDTVGGTTAGDAIVVARFERPWSFPPDSLRGGEVIARWVDGEPAAIEKTDGAGCVRSVAIPVSAIGDLAIRKEFVELVSSLSQPCLRYASLISADPSAVVRFAGAGGLAPREAFQSPSDARSDLAPWLFALALTAAIAELFVRRRERDSLALTARASASREARAA